MNIFKFFKKNKEESLEEVKKEATDVVETCELQEPLILKSITTGKLLALSEVSDQVFSQEILGKGAAIMPTDTTIYSPCDAQVAMVFPTKHAIGLKTAHGVEILIHIGIDTVGLEGVPFTMLVEANQIVKTGDKLVTVDIEYIKNKGLDPIIPVVVTNSSDYSVIKKTAARDVSLQDDMLIIEP